MNKKAAIELSINFLVIVIISLVILSAGILLTRQIIGGAIKIRKEVDAQTKAQIESLLEEGRPVAVPINKKTISKGKHDFFGVGVMNILEKGTFKIDVKFKMAIDKDENNITGVSAGDWLRYDNKNFVLGKNEDEKKPINVIVPKNTVAGTYIFDVTVKYCKGSTCEPNEVYGNLQKIYGVVP